MQKTNKTHLTKGFYAAVIVLLLMTAYLLLSDIRFFKTYEGLESAAAISTLHKMVFVTFPVFLAGLRFVLTACAFGVLMAYLMGYYIRFSKLFLIMYACFNLLFFGFLMTAIIGVLQLVADKSTPLMEILSALPVTVYAFFAFSALLMLVYIALACFAANRANKSVTLEQAGAV